jgi:hypothetical protein
MNGAKVSFRMFRSGVNVPGVRMLDAAEGVLGIEWIEGKSVRHLLPGGAEEGGDIVEADVENEEDTESGNPLDPLEEYEISVGAYSFTCFSIFHLSVFPFRCLDASHRH